jgi:hypothetical protein
MRVENCSTHSRRDFLLMARGFDFRADGTNMVSSGASIVGREALHTHGGRRYQTLGLDWLNPKIAVGLE